MSGEKDLTTQLATKQPVLQDAPYVFCSLEQELYNRLSFKLLGTFHEHEAITFIIKGEQANRTGLSYDSIWGGQVSYGGLFLATSICIIMRA